MKIFSKERIGKRRICYLFGKKIFSYTLGGGDSLKSQIELLNEKISRIEAKTEIAFQSKIFLLNERNKINRPFQEYSQIGADLVAYILHNGKKNGFYVDIGAHNGIDISNTYLFEQLGWNGICVEASLDTYAQLRKNRKCDCYNLAVFSKNIGKTTIITTKSASALNTLEINATDKHKSIMLSRSAEELDSCEVQTATFNEIMAHYPKITHIDFMSLDVEGGEFEVLKGIDFTKYTFSVMAIEHNYINQAIDKIKNFLEDKGYKILFFNAQDFFFVPNDRINWI